MQKSDKVDILVIGGGPAGSTAASMAAKSGLSVKICERSKFPREHVGESLLPASIAILEELGLKEYCFENGNETAIIRQNGQAMGLEEMSKKAHDENIRTGGWFTRGQP